MADYGCFPLGAPDGNLEYDALSISPELVDDLQRWADEYDAILVWDDPASSGFATQELQDQFVVTGRALARRLAYELGPNFVVVYFDDNTGEVEEIPRASDAPTQSAE